MARVHRSGSDRESDFRSLLKRRRWTTSEARVVIEAQSRSGLSSAAFARRHGLQVQRLLVKREDLAEIKKQIRNYARLRKFVERWIDLATELSVLQLQEHHQENKPEGRGRSRRSA